MTIFSSLYRRINLSVAYNYKSLFTYPNIFYLNIVRNKKNIHVIVSNSLPPHQRGLLLIMLGSENTYKYKMMTHKYSRRKM